MVTVIFVMRLISTVKGFCSAVLQPPTGGQMLHRGKKAKQLRSHKGEFVVDYKLITLLLTPHPLQLNPAPSPIKIWSPFLFPLSLGCPCDLLCSTDVAEVAMCRFHV